MSESLIGQTLNHFKILDKLGQGGMAMVYRAHQENLNRTVALKILPPEMTFDKSYIARFQQEAKAAAGLEHSHIVPIYEIGDAQGYYYIAMKYIEGGTLKETIDKESPMPLNRVLELLEPVGRALDYAHKRGVVHRDIKPSNVMITPEGWVYLTDFGLARANTEGTAGLTQAGTIMGTPEYMSPEQAQGLVVGAASDLYALAIMVYEMLTKKMPFSGDNPQSILFARVMRPPAPPTEFLKTLPSDVEDVLMKALARTPDQRFHSAAALMKALREATMQMRTPPPDFKSGGSDATIAVQRPASQPSYPPPSQPSYGQRPPSQPSYPAQGAPPSMPPSQPSYGQRPPSQPSYPAQGAPPSMPPSQPSYGQRPPSQPSMPPPSQPNYGQQRPASQPSYPPQNPVSQPPYVAPQTQQPSYAPQTVQSQPSFAPATPSYAPQTTTKAKKGKGLWLALGLIALVAIGVGAYFMFGRGGNANGAIERGNTAFERKGGLADAQKEYQAAAQANPKNFEAQQRLAFTYLMRGQPQQAETAANAAINAKPNDPLGHVWLSQAYSDQRKANESLAQAEEAIRLDANNPFSYVARSAARADLGLERDDEGLLEQASEDADKAIQLAQSGSNRLAQAFAYNAKGYANWQLYQYRTARDASAGAQLVEDGIDNYNRAIGLQDQLPLFHANLGYFYAQQAYIADFRGEPRDDYIKKAMTSFDAAIALDADYGNSYAGKGWTLIYEEKYEDAILQFDEALQRNSNDANALSGRGLAHWWLGILGTSDSQKDYETAAQNYEQAITVAPSMLDAYINLGNIYLYSLDNPDKANATFERALARDPKFADAIAGVGDVLYYQRYYIEAIAKYDEALALNPEDANAYLGKGLAQSEMGNDQESLATFDLALQYNNTLTNAYIGKANAQEKLGDKDGAKATLESGLYSVSEDDQAQLQEKLDALQ